MSGSQVLEIAIGLMFVYLFVSTVSSGIKEVIARLFDMRAKTLESAIQNMLADPKNTVTKDILQNHLIAGTVQPGSKPPYISSRNFALSLFDFIAAPQQGRSRSMEDLKTGVRVSKLPAATQKSVLGLLESAQGDVELARQRVENWYDDAMERVSGVYKRRSQIYIAVLGLVLCSVLNADSLMIARELWSDQALRNAVVAQAQERANKAQASGVCDDVLKCTTDSIRAAEVPPIGWARDGVRSIPEGWGWTWKIFGILISSIAVAMGAPFWFGLLNKVVNLRLTGSPPPDSRLPARR
jgi:hypothetical protein